MTEILKPSPKDRPPVSPGQMKLAKEISSDLLRLVLGGGKPITIHVAEILLDQNEAKEYSQTFQHDALGGKVLVEPAELSSSGWLIVHNESGIGKTGYLGTLSLEENALATQQNHWTFYPEGNIELIQWQVARDGIQTHFIQDTFLVIEAMRDLRDTVSQLRLGAE